MSSKASTAKSTLSSSLSPNANGDSNRHSGTDNVSSSIPHKSVSSQEQASSSFQEFLDEEVNAYNDYVRRSTEARQKIRRYSKAYTNIEKVVDDASRLQRTVTEKDAELRKKDAEIEGLNLVRQTTLRDFQVQYDEWNKLRNELQNRIERLELGSKETNARAVAAESTQAKLKEKVAQLEDMERKAARMEQKLRKADDKCRDLKRQLDQSTDRLREWDEYISVLQDVDYASFGSQISDLFTRFCNIVRDHFLIDLPAELLNNHNEWDKITDSLRVPVALPPRNSHVAKQSRMIAALSVIAIYLHKDIFTPCFVPHSAAAVKEGLKEILGRLFGEDPRKEAVTRALLLSTYASGDIEDEIKRTVQATSSHVLELLHPFLSGRSDSFHAGLDKLLYEAAQLWKLAQRSSKKVDASIGDSGFDKCHWDYLREFGELPSEATENTTTTYSFEMLSLFPCVYVPENEELPVLQAGCALWPDQKIVTAAEHEHKDCLRERRRPTGWGSTATGASMKRRRPSTVISGNPGSIASSPTSPMTRGTSFLERRTQDTTPKVEALNGSRGEE